MYNKTSPPDDIIGFLPGSGADAVDFAAFSVLMTGFNVLIFLIVFSAFGMILGGGNCFSGKELSLDEVSDVILVRCGGGGLELGEEGVVVP